MPQGACLFYRLVWLRNRRSTSLFSIATTAGAPPSLDDMAVSGRVRVAFCIDNLNVGGTELNAVRTAEQLDRDRFDLRVVCLQREGPLLGRYLAAGIAVDALPLGSLYSPRAIKQGFALARWIKRHRIDIVHAHDIYSNVFAVPWSRMAGARTITSRRWWEAFPGAHWKLATRAAYRLCDAALANSERVADLLRDTEKLSEDRIVVVPNFVDEDAFARPAAAELAQARAELGLHEGHRVIGIVANLLTIKDHESLLNAIAGIAPRWPELRVVLVGEGVTRSRLERQAGELGLGTQVILAGRRPNRPNPHHLFEISVLCSLSEGFPNSILEAMAAGKPVVATDVGAVADAVVHGETGLLVPAKDPPRLAAAIEQLLSDPSQARRMGEAGARRARQRYTSEIAMAALEGLYMRLVADRRKAPVEPRTTPRSRNAASLLGKVST
jgi:L-malate glycosyltransferase